MPNDSAARNGVNGLEDVTATLSEFARIVRVDPSAITHAIKGGRRLTSKSIAEVNGKSRIRIFEGCLEWHTNKEHRKDRTNKESRAQNGVFMPTDLALEMERHYSAKIKQAEYGKVSGELIPLAKAEMECGAHYRACRDAILTIPLTLSEMTRTILIRMLRGIDETLVQKSYDAIEEGVRLMRSKVKEEVRHALNHAAGDFPGSEERKLAMEKVQKALALIEQDESAAREI